MNYWLFKTEPEECSIDDFAKAPNQAIVWGRGTQLSGPQFFTRSGENR